VTLALFINVLIIIIIIIIIKGGSRRLNWGVASRGPGFAPAGGLEAAEVSPRSWSIFVNRQPEIKAMYHVLCKLWFAANAVIYCVGHIVTCCTI